MNILDDSEAIIQEHSLENDDTIVNRESVLKEEVIGDSETVYRDPLKSNSRIDNEEEISATSKTASFDKCHNDDNEEVNHLSKRSLADTKNHNFENNNEEENSEIIKAPLFHENEIEDSNFRKAVKTFYGTYNPEKLNTIDTILEQYEGYEIQLILHLIEKYNAVERCDLDLFSESFNEIDLLEIANHQISVKKNSDVSPTKESKILNAIEDVKDSKQNVKSNIGGRFLKGWNNASNIASPLAKSSQLNKNIIHLNNMNEKNNSIVNNDDTISTLKLQVILNFYDEMISRHRTS